MSNLRLFPAATVCRGLILHFVKLTYSCFRLFLFRSFLPELFHTIDIRAFAKRSPDASGGRFYKKGSLNCNIKTEVIFQALKEETCELLRAILEAADAEIAKAAKERKRNGLKVKERIVVRRTAGSLGEIEYRRTYYETSEGERVYLLEHLIGAEPYKRVSKALCAKLSNLSAGMSYEKSARHGDAGISRQTMNNKVKGIRGAAANIPQMEQTPGALHIFADEDHSFGTVGGNTTIA